jgi:hypothetical protein
MTTPDEIHVEGFCETREAHSLKTSKSIQKKEAQ